MRVLVLLLTLSVVLLSFGGCSGPDKQSATFFLMGTPVTLTLYTTDEEKAQQIFIEARGVLNELDALWSLQLDTSEVSRFNASDEVLDLDKRTADLIFKALEISAATDGAFDITVAPLTSLWQACGEENRLPGDELQEAMASVGYRKLVLSETRLQKYDSGLQIDLGGIGKGAAIEILLEYLKASGISGGMISFGSNVAVFGEKPNRDAYRIALRDPQNAAGTLGTLTMQSGEILSVSGDYERFVTINGERYHHLYDPMTGYPAETGLASVAVITHDGAVADALSTALFVMGYERAMEFYRSSGYSFEAIFVDHDNHVTLTDGLQGRFTEK